jgi:hypothetical protein
MLNKAAGKVRLTFKLEVDQLWIGTKGKYTVSCIVATRCQVSQLHFHFGIDRKNGKSIDGFYKERFIRAHRRP